MNCPTKHISEEIVLLTRTLSLKYELQIFQSPQMAQSHMAPPQRDLNSQDNLENNHSF